MKQTSILIAILFLFLVSCDEDKPIRKGLDKTGEELVLLTLHAGIHDKDLVDCYFGDLEIDSTLDYKIIDLKVELKELYKRIEKIIPKNKSEEFRKNYQLALTHSVFTRMRIADYESITFMEECENLYQFTPKLNSFTYYDSLLNELDKLNQGEEITIIRKNQENKSIITE